MKCLPPGSEPPPPPVSGLPSQVELITYMNEGGEAKQLTKKDLVREAEAKLVSRLGPTDLPVGTTVALHAQAPDADTKEGEATPFWVADVLQLEMAPTSSASTDASALKRVLVHYRLPMGRSGPENDVSKPWKLACVCRAVHNGHHEKWNACRAKRRGLSLQMATSKIVDWVAVDEVIETKLKLNQDERLHAGTKKRLLTHNAAWEDQLKMPKSKPGRSREQLDD